MMFYSSITWHAKFHILQQNLISSKVCVQVHPHAHTGVRMHVCGKCGELLYPKVIYIKLPPSTFYSIQLCSTSIR